MIGQDLRHHVKTLIVLRQHFVALPGFHAALFAGLQKRGEIFIQRAVDSGMGAAVEEGGDALHGGQVDVGCRHGVYSCSFVFIPKSEGAAICSVFHIFTHHTICTYLCEPDNISSVVPFF